MSEFLLDDQGRILVTDTGDPVVAFAQASPTPGGNFYGVMHVWDEPPIPLISISISVVVTIGVGVVIKGWAVDGRSTVAKIEIWGGGWNKVRKPVSVKVRVSSIGLSQAWWLAKTRLWFHSQMLKAILLAHFR